MMIESFTKRRALYSSGFGLQGFRAAGFQGAGFQGLAIGPGFPRSLEPRARSLAAWQPGTWSSTYHPTVEHHQNLAILVGGGPAPGINSVIGAATIRARLEGIPVFGVRDGFQWIMQGDIDQVVPLTIDAVSRIH